MPEIPVCWKKNPRREKRGKKSGKKGENSGKKGKKVTQNRLWGVVLMGKSIKTRKKQKF
jgi:hypothetical protein